MRQRVSVIATVLNEAESIGALILSLKRQTRPPDEVVIVDGGSTDGTVEAILGFGRYAGLDVTVRVVAGCNISQGRNAAIALASGEIIASADAGVTLAPDWLEHLVGPLDPASQEVETTTGGEPPDVVGGFFVADPRSTFELTLGATTLPRLDEIDPASFSPSSRSIAFRREAWEKVGGYPEWLDYCEDLLFDFALGDAGYRFAFAPRAVVQFRPRSTLWAYMKQYYRYARGDGKADFYRYRHLARYATYLIGGPVLVVLGQAQGPLWWLVLGAAVAAMLRAPLRRLRPWLRDLPRRERLVALVWMPLVRLGGDLAKMVGYPVGVWWRLRHAPRAPWPKRQR